MSEIERQQHLEALRQTKTRVLELQLMMEPLIEQIAANGNPVASYLVSELAQARTAMVSENIAASAFLAEAGRG